MNAYTATELSSSVKRALDHYAVSSDWKKTVKRAMNTDFSWDKTSQRYLDLYQGILG
jgi:starch synthase